MNVAPRQSAIRVSAPAPDASDWDRWHRVIAVMSTADDWGSSSAGGTPEIWAEVKNEVIT